ncbi:MAG: hypothetical protein ABIK89_14435, partial [Planctomycetota bacterium]
RRVVEWIAVVAAGLAFVVAKNIAPLHASRVGHHEAAQWLAAEAPEPGMVVDTRGWTGLYSGRPTFSYADAPLVLADSRLAYLVVEQSELEYASTRGRTLRTLLDAAGEQVAEFPQQQALPRGWQTVIVYRWYPERFRQCFCVTPTKFLRGVSWGRGVLGSERFISVSFAGTLPGGAADGRSRSVSEGPEGPLP